MEIALIIIWCAIAGRDTLAGRANRRTSSAAIMEGWPVSSGLRMLRSWQVWATAWERGSQGHGILVDRALGSWSTAALPGASPDVDSRRPSRFARKRNDSAELLGVQAVQMLVRRVLSGVEDLDVDFQNLARLDDVGSAVGRFQ